MTVASCGNLPHLFNEEPRIQYSRMAVLALGVAAGLVLGPWTRGFARRQAKAHNVRRIASPRERDSVR